MNIKYPIYFFLIFFLIPLSTANAQINKFTISGYVKDAGSGEAVTGAVIAVKELPATGVISNDYGFYSLTIPEGTYTLRAQSFGFVSKDTFITLDKNLKMDFPLAQEVMVMDTVVVTAVKKNENITQPHMGVTKFEMKELNKIPVLLGERDVLKTLQLLPGVKSAGEGNTGFYVRGGGADQNLIILDEAPVYNASHLLGFFSVFNSDAIKDVTLYKGGMPAEYGGRLSSVIDIRMSEGNNKKFGVSGGIGLISSRLKIEGPIVKDKGSFTISARRSYADLFLKLSSDSSLRDTRLYFYDINAKGNYRINENNRIYVSGYFGRDILGLRDLFGIDWGNATGTIRWNHSFSSKLFSNTSLIASNYSYKIRADFNDADIFITSRIRDFNLKQDFEYYPGVRSTIRFGFNTIYHKIVPGVANITNASGSSEDELTNRRAWDNAFYGSWDFKISDKLSLVAGLRLTLFSVLGPGDFYTINNQGQVLDTTTYGSGKFVKTYVNPEPRLAVNYTISESSSVKFSYARTTQNLHLLTNTTASTPTDLWIPSSNYIRPEIADQVSAGYFRNFKEDAWQFSTEVYYRNLRNQIDYKNGAQLNFNEQVEADLLIGKGRAYGVEFLLRKKFGKLSGWIGYTLSRTERQFDQINNGKYFPARQDRRHDISIVVMYDINKKWTLSGNWVYYTGNAVTFPSGKYTVNGHIINYYTERNGYRMPPYHRMDVGATLQGKKTEKYESSWVFSIYNLYARENPYVITFKPSKTDPSRTVAVQTSLFRLVPSVTYNFKF